MAKPSPNYSTKHSHGALYKTGRGSNSNCSLIEALNYVETLGNVKVKKIYKKDNRVGDHIWYISDIRKFKKHYPEWKQKYDTKKIIKELIYNFK